MNPAKLHTIRVTHLSVTGPKESLASLKLNASSPEECFSLQSLFPMPNELVLSPYDVEANMGYDVFFAGNWREYIALNERKTDADSAKQKLIDDIESRYPNAKEQGRKYAELKQHLGYTNSADWAAANWGALCDVSNTSVREDDEFTVFRFTSSWVYPQESIRKLSLVYPELKFTAVVQCGTGTVLFIHVWSHGGKLHDMKLANGFIRFTEKPRRSGRGCKVRSLAFN